MDSMDNVRERFEALEQQTEQLKQETQALKAHTYTVERQLRWWRGISCGLLMIGLISLPLPSGTAKEEHTKRTHREGHSDKENEDLIQRVQLLEDQVKALQDKLNQTTRDLYTRISGHPWVACAMRTKRGSDTHPCAQRTLRRVC